MRCTRWQVVALLLIAGSTACSQRQSRPADAAPPSGDVVVIRGSDLTAGRLLTALRQKVSGMTVAQGQSGCPAITLRGRRLAGNPSIFVDGTRMADSCALVDITTTDVDRVEIYRGSAGPAQVAGNPNGSIVVYRIKR
jgi:outer membrane receptor for ferric coprogen and ferric-rhodotorulic acid